ncbi:MAG: hypothetical protein AAF368_06280, partial [Planctomycetota bacterium]
GSSRTYHGFIPGLFDEVLAQRGHPLKSFNLGVTGLKLSGNVDVLRRLEAVMPEGPPRWLLIDPESPETLRDLQRRSLQGVVNWYDARTVQLELSWILKSDMPAASRWTAAQSILHAFVFRTALVGRATPLLDPWLERGLPPEEIAFRLGPAGDGFRSKDGANKPRPHQRHRQFLRRRDHYLEQLDNFRRASRYEGPALEPLTPEGLAMFKRIEDAARALGLEPIFVTQPAFNLHGELRAAAELEHIATPIFLNDPGEFPEFFEIEARWEEAHLSAEGAKRFTRALAGIFADRLDEARDRGEPR